MSELNKISKEDLNPENIYQYVDEFNIYGYIYRIVNNINGKTYVGLRKISKDYTWNTYWGSGKLIKKAISKNGKQNFTKELLCIASNHDELCDKEIELIFAEKANGHSEYNLLLNRWDVPTNRPKNRDPDEVRAEQIATFKKTAYTKYLEKIDGKEELIINTYLLLKNIRKTAKELNIGVTVITKFLRENDIVLNYQNVYGIILSEDKKQEINNGVINISYMYKKQCLLESCNRIFTTTHKIANYCSNKCKDELITIKKTTIKKSNQKRIIYFSYCSYNECNNYYSSTRKNDNYCSNDCKLTAAKIRKPGNSIILPDDPEIIRKLYWDDDLSATNIAEQYNCNEQTIRNYMKRNNIAIRSFKESTSNFNKKNKNKNFNSVSCLNCQEIFHISNFNKHYDYCVNRQRCLEDNCNNFLNKKNKNGYCIKHRKITINICAHDSCDKELSKKEAKYCRDHMVITHSYKNCENCGKEVISSNYKRHYEYCINATICATNKCKLPTKNTRSKYCWKH